MEAELHVATCGDCIHADVCERNPFYIEFARNNPAYCEDFRDAQSFAPVVHGAWEKRRDAIGFVRCSACHDCNIYDEWPNGKKWRYCPNCGAKMDGEMRNKVAGEEVAVDPRQDARGVTP